MLAILLKKIFLEGFGVLHTRLASEFDYPAETCKSNSPESGEIDPTRVGRVFGGV